MAQKEWISKETSLDNNSKLRKPLKKENRIDVDVFIEDTFYNIERIMNNTENWFICFSWNYMNWLVKTLKWKKDRK